MNDKVFVQTLTGTINGKETNQLKLQVSLFQAKGKKGRKI